MLQTGVVKKTDKNTAEVEIVRSTACGGSCAACGMCPGRATTVIAANKTGAATGDTVVVNMPDKKVLGAAFLVYIVPLIALVAGYFTGNTAFGTELWGVVSGLVLMALAFLVIILIDRKADHSLPEIISVSESG